MKNKRGSHVGVVVSFVIFVTFLIFLYSILEPATKRERDREYLLDTIALNLISNTSSNMTSVIINVSEPSSKDCINIQNVDEEDIPDEWRDQLIIKNSSEDVLNYEVQGQGFEIETGTGFSGVLKVYYSEGIIGSQTDLGGCDPKPFTVGTIKSYNEIFESKLYELNESYFSDYEDLKDSLGIPDGTEFSFSLLDIERNKIFESEIEEPPATINIYVQEIPIQYLDDSGEINFGFLIIKIW